ncbi:MAG: hypothetical protein KGJ23_12280 [Euryarchaeota archaeon]|nr:hypothetical protein [Euryarchaeota archaeon]MDE1837374.1 hypothetical protein [Euryarchaeota archaeon]MDE1881825.1 hypothetical protein [Euryarchaeota archaeon]MDE2045652.1 hypothetical protein [Thermoplasmata archaeon]
MAARTVALDEESYALLRAARRPDESFSETVKRLAKPRKGIGDLWGAWANATPAETKQMSRLQAALAEGDRRRAELIRRAWE